MINKREAKNACLSVIKKNLCNSGIFVYMLTSRRKIRRLKTLYDKGKYKLPDWCCVGHRIYF